MTKWGVQEFGEYDLKENVENCKILVAGLDNEAGAEAEDNEKVFTSELRLRRQIDCY